MYARVTARHNSTRTNRERSSGVARPLHSGAFCATPLPDNMENAPVAPPVLAAWRVGSEAADDTWSITPVFELIGGMPGQSKVKLAALRDALAAREPAILTIGELKQNLTDAELTEVIKSENLGNRLKKQIGRFLSATESGYQWTPRAAATTISIDTAEAASRARARVSYAHMSSVT